MTHCYLSTSCYRLVVIGHFGFSLVTILTLNPFLVYQSAASLASFLLGNVLPSCKIRPLLNILWITYGIPIPCFLLALLLVAHFFIPHNKNMHLWANTLLTSRFLAFMLIMRGIG